MPRNEPKHEPKHELEKDLPAYLVFLILGNIKALREISPDHILVKAVEDVLQREVVEGSPDAWN